MGTRKAATAFLLALLGASACAHSARVDSSPEANSDAAAADTGPGAAPTDALDASPAEAAVLVDGSNACAPGGSGLMLECSSACPDSLFANVALADNFDHATTYAQNWTGTYVVPTVTPAGLQFGPHPASTNWWETYSPTATNETDFGNVLVCVRFRMHVGGDPGSNGLQLSIRGGSEGMVLGYGAADHGLVLTRKIDATATWQTYATASVPLAAGEDDIEMALYGNGSAFHAEMKEVATGRVYALSADEPALPATGPVELLGWQLAQALVVTRVAIGTPTADAAARMLR